MVLPAFFTLNACLSMLNRWALGIKGFSFPLLLTASHALFGFLFMLPALIFIPGVWPTYRSVLQREWRGMVVVGCWVAVNIALNNLSLVYITLSLNQVIRYVQNIPPDIIISTCAHASALRNHQSQTLSPPQLHRLSCPSHLHIRRASIPLVTAAMTAVLEKKPPRTDEAFGLVILSLGVSTAISEASASGDTRGVVLCALSVIAGAAMLTTTARVLAGRVNAVQLAFFTSPVTCAFLTPPFVAMELGGFLRYVAQDPRAAAGILVGGSVLAGLYNVVHNDLVSITDPVTTCVLGQVKIVALMLLSALFLDEGRDFTRRMSAGCACAILGFSLYSWAKLRQQKARLRITIPATPRVRSRSRSRSATPGSKGRRGHRTPEAKTPPQTLPGLQTPGSHAPSRSSRARLRTPSTTRRRTPGSLV